MKPVYVFLTIGGLLLIVVAVMSKRNSVYSMSPYGGTGYGGANVFSFLTAIGGKALDKIQAPSASPPNGGTYYTGTSSVQGNQLVDSGGNALTYGTD